jgi:hypothetical protein
MVVFGGSDARVRIIYQTGPRNPIYFSIPQEFI